MSRRNRNGSGSSSGAHGSPRLDLKLNLSLPQRAEGWPSRLTSESPLSSCVSSENNSPEAAKMVVAGCPRCLMYVMLSVTEDEPRCPRCNSAVLLEFLHDSSSPTTANSSIVAADKSNANNNKSGQ